MPITLFSPFIILSHGFIFLSLFPINVLKEEYDETEPSSKLEFLYLFKSSFKPPRLEPLFFEEEKINDFSSFGQGIQIAPAIGS